MCRLSSQHVEKCECSITVADERLQTSFFMSHWHCDFLQMQNVPVTVVWAFLFSPLNIPGISPTAVRAAGNGIAAPDPVRDQWGSWQLHGRTGYSEGQWSREDEWGEDVYFEAEGLSALAGNWSHMQVVDSVARQIKKSRPRVDLPLKWEWGLDIRQKT